MYELLSINCRAASSIQELQPDSFPSLSTCSTHTDQDFTRVPRCFGFMLWTVLLVNGWSPAGVETWWARSAGSQCRACSDGEAERTERAASLPGKGLVPLIRSLRCDWHTQGTESEERQIRRENTKQVRGGLAWRSWKEKFLSPLS